MAKAVWIGTSGYNYPEWRGSFYPDGMRESEMLPYYAARFPTVEINYTFYRMPSAKAIEGWAAATPERFRLTLKAPQRITHQRKLRDCADLVQMFLGRAAMLGEKLGVLLFQLPPFLREDLDALDEVLACLPSSTRAAFEFRHTSWLDDAVYARLGSRNIALCVADSENMTVPTVATADYGYFRLRDEGYQKEDIARWARAIRETNGWGDVFVYFKHEEAGKGPEFARQLMDELPEIALKPSPAT